MRRELVLFLSILVAVPVACAPPELGTRRPSRGSSQDQESTAASTTRSKSPKPSSSTTQQTTAVVAPTPSKGCNGGAEKAPQPSGLSANMTLEVAGSMRSYDLEVPDGYDPKRAYPVVFVFHASGGTGGNIRTSFKFSDIASDKALFVYPSGRNKQWDLDSPAGDNQDIALFDALTDSLEATYCIDSARVFATGFSNGAYFANQLGCRRGDRLRAVASHGGGGPYGGDGAYDDDGNLKCVGPSPAALIVHGQSDMIVPVNNADASLKHWTWANDCSGETSEAEPDPCVSFDGCNKPVVSCRVTALGHSIWSEGTRTTWDFFASF
ncbi:MAG TPA: hypothetical protein VM925_21175 [Labilithrix sp.]|nr:hypothetical protein [Labilithrix sp.]